MSFGLLPSMLVLLLLLPPLPLPLWPLFRLPELSALLSVLPLCCRGGLFRRLLFGLFFVGDAAASVFAGAPACSCADALAAAVDSAEHISSLRCLSNGAATAALAAAGFRRKKAPRRLQLLLGTAMP